MTAAVPSLERRQVLAGLGSSGRGLSADEAAARRAEAGANRLPAARRRSVLAEFGAQFANMFAVVLMAAGITFTASSSRPRTRRERPGPRFATVRPRSHGQPTFSLLRADHWPFSRGCPRTRLRP